ncbi:hypothetical protein RB195_002948 [Necator americanus]|uniref:Glycosyltransferase family 92 protein n=1 Tax=Necator americanus TaxID=51031 RepID=A0ABR1DMQ3_NECAM
MKKKPRKEMLEKPHVGMLRFTPRWVLRTTQVPAEYEGDVTLREHLPTLVFHNTSPIPAVGASAKYVVDPTKVFWLWVHRVKYFFPGYSEVHVDPNVAYIRHYRDTAAERWGELWQPGLNQYGRWELTDYPKRLLNVLYTRVKQRLDDVYGNRSYGFFL